MRNGLCDRLADLLRRDFTVWLMLSLGQLGINLFRCLCGQFPGCLQIVAEFFLYGLHRIHKRPLDRRQVCLIYRGLQFLYVINSIRLTSQHTGDGFIQLILCRKALGEFVIQITGDQIGGVGKLRIFKQCIDHLRMQELVDRLSDEYDWSDSVSNLSAKLQRESIRYKEVVELADVLGYDIVWQKRRDNR